jgi:hypothetical protein
LWTCSACISIFSSLVCLGQAIFAFSASITPSRPRRPSGL